MNLELRPITGDELPTFALHVGTAFGWNFQPEHLPEWERFLELDRTLAAFSDGTMVGTSGALSFELTAPGGVTAPTGGVTVVTVSPTHRRRGILTAMMRGLLDQGRERGEPTSILLASESLIYGRFGYGLATTQVDYQIERRSGALRSQYDSPGMTALVDKERVRRDFPPLYDRVRRSQPGFIDRKESWWDDWLTDPERERGGASGRFYVVYERAGEVEGYLAYRMKSEWQQGIARTEMRVKEFMTATSEAYVGLWQFCMGMDLVERVRFESRPLDEPVRWMLADPRRLQYSEVGDHLWARLVDIPSALQSRRYAADGAITLAVEDPFCPDNSGTYRLEGGPDGATCRRKSDTEPDLALGVDDLGAVYLGGVSFRTLARAGRVEERTPNAIAPADAMFVSDIAPFCANHF